MNREILFRGKRIDNGEFVSGSLFFSKNGECEICTGTPRIRITWEVLPETVGQYTGLRDKNEKKIFEGDIVLFGWKKRKEVFAINFVDGEFRAIPKEITKEIWDIRICGYTNKFEVIGNIYDNGMEGLK